MSILHPWSALRRLSGSARGLALPAALSLAAVCWPPALAGQETMRETFSRLFVFGEGESALFLGGSAGVPATEVHGNHFIPAENAANASLLSFFENAISNNVAAFPLSSTVASETFTFEGGVPQATSTSFGPIFAERSQTVGRGRLNAGVTFSRFRFSEIRGVDLDAVELRFTHENSDFPGCDDIFGGDCSLYGVPGFENDVIRVDMELDIAADVFAFAATYGLLDWLDLSLALPVIDLSLEGSSVATVQVATGEEALHFFEGSPENPGLSARTQIDGEAAGIGDLAVRLKARAAGREPWLLAVLGEVRAPTGREEDFLGTGEWNAKGLLILSGLFGDFSPHLNAGYEYRGRDVDQDEFELALGFDQRLSDWATLAVDMLGAFKVGDPLLRLPEEVRIEAPFPRTIAPTNIPERRDDILDGALGFKFRTGGGLVVLANVMVPLNDGGLRAGVTPTFGLEYTP